MSTFTPLAEQAAVITAPAGQRMLVKAGPGTGKTEVVARRLAHLTGPYGLRQTQILVLSFSRSAVKALISRIRSLGTTHPSAIEDLRFLSVRTCDSWIFRMLRFLGHDPGALLQNDFDGNIRLFLNELDRLGPDGIHQKSDLRLKDIRHLIIDEYQDLAGVRAALVQKLLLLLVAENKNCGFTMLGDPHQAIYNWSIGERGADVCGTSTELAEWIESAFAPELVVNSLSVNHRAGTALDNLIKRASTLLSSCEGNSESPLPGLQSLILEAGSGARVEDVFNVLASETPSSDGMAILCRSNSQILQLAASVQYLAYKKEKTLRVFHLNAGTPPRALPTWIAKLLYRYKVLQITKSNFFKVFRLTFITQARTPPCSGDAEAAWRLLLGYARHGEDETFLDMNELRERITWPDSLPDDEGESDEVVTLTTIHQSKGLEYKIVRIVLGGHLSIEGDPHEEGRVLFVGMSRAREALSLLELDNRYPFYNKSFGDGRTRWHRWIFDQQQLELGCDGDVNQESIIRCDLMGGEDMVIDTQKLLAEHENKLIGARVTLEKTLIPGRTKKRFHYKITLDYDGKTWCLGFLKEYVTRDLLGLSNGKWWLPSKIYNLRIGAVTSSVGNGIPHYTVPSPWKESRFWLSACIHGIGQCKTY
jgi:ATP-dependent DNA helicase UvrD/PcrA